MPHVMQCSSVSQGHLELRIWPVQLSNHIFHSADNERLMLVVVCTVCLVLLDG